MSRDLVYVVGGPDPDNCDDLRHSLRSIARHLRVSIRDVWVVGDVPPWFTGARLPLEPKPEKFANQRASLTAYVNLPDAAETFVLLNDDMILTRDVTEVEGHHLGPASDYFDANTTNTWHRAGILTTEWAASRGVDVLAHEAHVPLEFNTAALRDLLNEYPADRPVLVGELYALAGARPAGRRCGNAKVRAGDDLAEKLAQPLPCVSGSPDTWPGALSEWALPAFPDPSPWESAR